MPERMKVKQTVMKKEVVQVERALMSSENVAFSDKNNLSQR